MSGVAPGWRGGAFFESVLRKGVQVRTHYLSRLQDGKLVGTTVARYQVTGEAGRKIRRTGVG